MGDAKKKEVRKCRYCDGRMMGGNVVCIHCKMVNTPEAFNPDDDGTVGLDDAEAMPLTVIETGPWDICYRKSSQTGAKPGVVLGSVVLLGGVPGAGKSTHALQLCDAMAAATKREGLYIATEENSAQIRDRADRLGITNRKLIRLLPMGATPDMAALLMTRRPSFIVVDSLPGLIGDMEQAANFCKDMKPYAVELNCPAIIIDHVTKEHDLAGLMALQHHVDTLLVLDAFDDTPVREMTVKKNRFGEANFSIPLKMTGTGLVAHEEEETDES